MMTITPELIESLQSVLNAPSDHGMLYAESLREEIESIGDVASHEVFWKICDLADLAYPASEMSNEAIAANRATPDLIRYVLDAFRSYRDQVEQATKPLSATKRGEFLQLAFGERGGSPGGNTRARPWSKEGEMEIVASFARALEEVRIANPTASSRHAWLSAFEKTFDLAFAVASRNGRDPRSKSAQRDAIRLAKLVNEHYPLATFFK